MQFLVIGDQSLFDELRKKLGNDHHFTHVEGIELLEYNNQFDCVFDFTAEESIDNISELLEGVDAGLYFINAVKSSLHEISFLLGELPSSVIGFNGLPGFLDRDIWEVTTLENELPAGIADLPIRFVRVDDRVGMVTPRVICMIINEAYYTVQEGTASREDIDLGMKLGTGYPYGPFEWAERIGIQHVYELLEAMYEDTRDERYKICPLLKKEYLKNEN
ncbi:3-hydroxyacyl-CoA dehydrogenase family protein [Fulvivirga sedimenti]|uniref:3-hydroxyacyl-CoA dehydrogenase n=1 Tax=Fulvivirga sedimenti TaxID=2879465 RepID=A0A9X1HLK5_9BACT|nr:3-hydroxyacyl-CoA dehydrogenase family protein [Fulvivirga sedimenti]MCA6074398.1 3-hydroxyacyl-CoA dehydrogenase [Fulvivirga sedimenti]